MRVLERRAPDEARGGVQRACHGVDGGDLHRVPVVEVRQEAREPGGEHGLAGAGWADEEEVMPSGRGDLERVPGGALADDVGQVGVL
jgi:hypothetical protein